MNDPAVAGAGQDSLKSCEQEAIRCLLDVFSSLTCTRDPRGRRYDLSSVLALALIAVLAGCKNPTQIYVFGKTHPRLLPKLNFRPPRRPRKKEHKSRIPSPNEDTIASILDRVDKKELNERLVVFLSRMIVRGAVAAIDGKALRGTDDYVLSLFVNDLCHVAWQEDIGKKENEQSALERILPAILERYPQIRIFTGDAAFGHKKFAAMLIQARRDYFLQLKSPHGTDVALAKDSFRQIGAARQAEASSLEKRGGLKDRKS